MAKTSSLFHVSVTLKRISLHCFSDTDNKSIMQILRMLDFERNQRNKAKTLFLMNIYF